MVNFEFWFHTKSNLIQTKSVQAVLALQADGATVPFMARYRKEKTGNLDEVQIRSILDHKEQWDELIHRKSYIIEEIERQGKLTPELKASIESTFDSALLEDLYLPYKKKRQTKAQKAREAGLEPLANWIWDCGHGLDKPQPGQTLDLWAFTFKNEGAGITDAKGATDGAQDILIERISEHAELREFVRQKYLNDGFLVSEKGPKPKPNSKYENYYNYQEKISNLKSPSASHRYLAIRRGWIEEELKISLGGSRETQETFSAELLEKFESFATNQPEFEAHNLLLKCGKLALRAHVTPAIENELQQTLKEIADEASIQVFSDNVRQLLLASPLGPKAVLGIDPGIRTGSKVAIIENTGKYVSSFVIHFATEEQKESSKKALEQVLGALPIDAIAIGNGTHGRETEMFVRKVLKDLNQSTPVVMVNEAGASVYSASDIAREEFPDLDITVRGAISIARRLQDPLAELVKIDPKSIGVGQYQHDINQNRLKKSLSGVVIDCVNSVGVNLNTASEFLLSFVSGIGQSLAKSVVEVRKIKGVFTSREDLLQVPRFGKKNFEQSAGFLRVPESSNPLDNTGVHPEHYSALESAAAELNTSISALLGDGAKLLQKSKTLRESVGEYTLKDIINDLEKPGRDPRDPFVAFQYREDIFELKDLQKEMICPGIITNVTNFGAFVDIGVHQDGLVHISELTHRFVKDPKEVVKPGDRVQVKVLDINHEKRQLSLSIKQTQPPPAQLTREPRQGPSSQRNTKGGPSNFTPRHNKTPAQQGGSNSNNRRPAATQPPSPYRDSQKNRGVVQKQSFNNAFSGLAALRDKSSK